MSKRRSDSEQLREAGVTAVAAGAGVAGALVAGGTASVAVASGAFATAPGVLAIVADRVLAAKHQVMRKRFEAWVENVFAAQEFGTPQRLAAVIEEGLGDPRFRDGLHETFRHLMDALDERVVPAIAGLSAPYIAGTRTPDAFLRTVGRSLADMTSADLATLVLIVDWLVAELEANPSAGREVGVAQIGLAEAQTDKDLDGCLLVSFGLSARDRRSKPINLGRVAALFKILVRGGVGREAPTGAYDEIGGQGTLVLASEDIVRMASTVLRALPRE